VRLIFNEGLAIDLDVENAKQLVDAILTALGA
jgi:hypothetical protein